MARTEARAFQVGKPHLSAENAAIRPVLSRHGLINHRQAGGPHDFRLVPKASLYERYAEHGERDRQSCRFRVELRISTHGSSRVDLTPIHVPLGA